MKTFLLAALLSYALLSYAYVKTDAPVNEARLFVYTSSEKDEMRALPPTDDGLIYHVRRSCYEAGWVWGNTLSQQDCMRLTHWGWDTEQGGLNFTWTRTDKFGAELLAQLITVYKCTTAK